MGQFVAPFLLIDLNKESKGCHWATVGPPALHCFPLPLAQKPGEATNSPPGRFWVQHEARLLIRSHNGSQNPGSLVSGQALLWPHVQSFVSQHEQKGQLGSQNWGNPKWVVSFWFPFHQISLTPNFPYSAEMGNNPPFFFAKTILFLGGSPPSPPFWLF